MQRVCIAAAAAVLAGCAAGGGELRYTLRDGEIAAPLTSAAPDAERGRKILISRDSNCILCHAAPETGERFFGNLAPPLSGVGRRLNAAQLRARIVDPFYFDKDTIMPAYYRVGGLNRVAENLRGKPILSAEQIEDVIAYLLTLQ
ncbi:MAG: sulfur oxidation c-type cytochrome SoxX [Betaproteobacteria bacterium]|nr:sulfur oxidation c-type cytochrome SoxX [Betaproteobacteria bacterium]